MGGVDVDEPPSKRVKVSSLELGSLSNTLSPLEPTGPLGGLMARHLSSQGNEDMVGSKGLIKKVEFVRIIAKALYSLGYERTGALLEEESGIHLHSAAVKLFRKQVLDGNWDGSVAALQKIGLSDDNILRSASFKILERKFLELVEKDRVMDAINTLRYEIAPLNIDKKRMHELCTCMISPSQRGLLGFCNLSGEPTNSRLELLQELLKLLPPSVMIPERRLEHLVEQALNVQRNACYLHNALDSSLSLYVDHHCGKDQIPSRTAQVLQAHNDEVWFVQFSNNGRFLASSSTDKTAIVWEVHEDGEVLLKHTLNGHDRTVTMAAWSPDDKQLLTCGLEENVRRWDVHTGNCLHIYGKSGLGLISCGWFPDGEHFFTGVSDKTTCMWDLDGKELECWKGQRTTKTSDMAVTKDGKRIIILCRERVILLLDKETKLEQLIEEDQIITSFSLSKDDKYLLVNLINQEIHLWSILEDPELVIKYRGHKRSRFLVTSCFGGFEQAFVASGSEDSQVYIWHRNSGDLIWALPGHTGVVNCVSWNPTNPHMLASASDDCTIRIWGVNLVNLKRKEVHSNGSNGISHHCNGNIKW
ncbi:putative transcription factor WD40-like family [Dioscorea sansibarensis]